MMPRPATTKLNRWIIALVVGGCAALNAAVLGIVLLHPLRLNSDFMAFWSFPRFAASRKLQQIYDPGVLMAFQQQLYPGFRSFYPFTYPPDFLIPIWWMKFFAFGTAQIVWTVCGLAALSAATMLMFPERRWLVLLAVLASPAALLNAMGGQTAFFSAGLLLAGFALLPRRPLIAGIAFGLLTAKPQLGVLIPLFLLARGDWRAMAAAGVTAGALIAVSCAVFPPDLWRLWAHVLPVYQAQYFAGKGIDLNALATPAAALFVLGASAKTAWMMQTLFSLVMAVTVWHTAGRAPYPIAAAILLTGSFLAVPHAYAYDTVTLPAAMALCLTRATQVWQVLLGALVYLGPLLLLSPAHHWFLYALPETALFAAMAAVAESSTATRKTVVDGGQGTPKHSGQ